MATRGCMHYARLVSSGVGVLVGLLACVTFAVPWQYQHISGSVLAFMSAVFAAVCFMLHVLHHRRLLPVYHSSDTFKGLASLGFVVCNISFALTAWALFSIFYYKKGMEPFDNNPVITAVWSFMTGKWAAFLWSASRMYSRLLNSGSLLEESI